MPNKASLKDAAAPSPLTRFGEAMRTRARRTRRRWYRSPVVIGTLTLLALWCWMAIGADTFILVGLLAALAGIARLAVRRRDVLASMAIAVLTTATPGVTVIMLAASTGAPPPSAGVLTGFILAGPIPTLTAWVLMRPPVLSRPLASLVGSVILLLGTLPSIFGSQWGSVWLIGALVLSCSALAIRHRRTLARLTSAFQPGHDGWTDLGSRRLPTGELVTLLVGPRAVICAVNSTAATVTRGANRAVAAAVNTARALGVPPKAVHPVLITALLPASRRSPVEVERGKARAQVSLVGDVDELRDLIRFSPSSGPKLNRHALTRAGLLVTKGELQ